jgi:hypothetical protein
MSIALISGEQSASFLKKRSKKRLASQGRWPVPVAMRAPQARLYSKSFLLLFFKKEALFPCLSLVR